MQSGRWCRSRPWSPRAGSATRTCTGQPTSYRCTRRSHWEAGTNRQEHGSLELDTIGPRGPASYGNWAGLCQPVVAFIQADSAGMNRVKMRIICMAIGRTSWSLSPWRARTM